MHEIGALKNEACELGRRSEEPTKSKRKLKLKEGLAEKSRGLERMKEEKNYASLPIENKFLLLNNWRCNHILSLYERGVDVYQTLFSFIKAGLRNGELCLFAYDCASSELYLEMVFGKDIAAGIFHPFRMGEKMLSYEVKDLNARLEELGHHIPNDYPALRAAIDFGKLTTPYTTDEIVDVISRLRSAPFPIRSMTAFNASFLPGNAMKALLGIYENVVVSTKNEHMMMLLNYRSIEVQKSSTIETIPISTLETIPISTLERFVKKNLETIVTSIMLQGPLCGYDLIRRIYHHYHTFLSQGTIYPLLYDLQRRSFLTIVKSGNLRSKVYALTKQGEEEAKARIDNFLCADKYLLESIRKT